MFVHTDESESQFIWTKKHVGINKSIRCLNTQILFYSSVQAEGVSGGGRGSSLLPPLSGREPPDRWRIEVQVNVGEHLHQDTKAFVKSEGKRLFKTSADGRADLQEMCSKPFDQFVRIKLDFQIIISTTFLASAGY